MPGNLVPNIRNLRWGPNPHERVDILQHSIRDAGGNPVVFFRHGGGGAGGDKKQPWMSSFDCNSLFHYLNTTGSLSRHFDVMSVQTEQGRWDFPTSLTGNTPLETDAAYNQPEIYSRPIYWPDTWTALHRFVQWLKARAKGRLRIPEIGNVDLGISPTDIFAFGDSYGGTLVTMLGVTAPRQGTVSVDYNTDWVNGQYDSRVRGIINFRGCQEFRSRGNPNVQSDEWLDYAIVPEYHGTGSFAEWARIPQQIKAQMSPAWYLEQASVAYWTPYYLIYEQVGTGNANPSTPWTDAHDWGQYTRMVNKMNAAGVEYRSALIANTAWLGAGSAAVNAPIFDWMNSLIEEP